MFLVGCFILTRYLVAWQIKRATGMIIHDLESQEAFDPLTAVDLPYTKQNPLRIGMRNYPAKAIEYMIYEGVVGKTASDKYYLKVRPAGVN